MQKIIKLLKRARLKNKPKQFFPVYDICVVYKSSKRKKVFEKVGVYSRSNRLLKINVFRLAYWLSRGVALSGNAYMLFERSHIINI